MQYGFDIPGHIWKYRDHNYYRKQRCETYQYIHLFIPPFYYAEQHLADYPV